MNNNLLSPINFVFKLGGTPNVNYKVQKVRIPGLSIGQAATDTPFIRLNQPGNIIQDPFAITFKIGSDMEDYLEIFNWIVGLGHPEKLAPYERIKSDASVHILGSSKNPNIRYNFTDVFPISISGFDLDVTMTDIKYVDVTVEFDYDLFYITKERDIVI